MSTIVIDSKIGLSSSLTLLKTSSLHGYLFTGLCACCKETFHPLVSIYELFIGDVIPQVKNFKDFAYTILIFISIFAMVDLFELVFSIIKKIKRKKLGLYFNFYYS